MAEAKGSADEGSGTRDPEQIEREIEQTREELGETVAAVAEKTDVKGKAKRKANQTKARAKSKAEEVKQTAGLKREQLGAKAHDVTPESAAAGAQRAATAVREKRAPVAIAAAFVAGFAVGRMTGR
jgi:Protein of unknown function (DUF3618)